MSADAQGRVPVSVIIAAHDEEAVIGRCLDALTPAVQGVPLQVIVSANGCSDATAEIARARGAQVVERPEPGKPGALNAAERVAVGFPRVYLDADIVPPAGALGALAAALRERPGVLATMPVRRVVTTGRTWPVRAYFRINQRLPVFRSGLFGRGLIVVSEAGRARFAEFPALTADDLFLDAQFAEAEKSEVAGVVVEVESPRTTADLVRRLVRVRRGNAEMRRAAETEGVAVRSADRWSWLRDVVRHDQRLAPAAVAYLAITLLAAVRARRSPSGDWGRDESTRTPGTEPQKAGPS
ncbi:glycosyltransferase [Microbacterium sp. ASV81]|uniref:4,4'-diaponeurosporenoate glycosyltransferase n=1 Tax=Microbacterium capsulatum TaxID=3041921 RepID=A0ABU0XHX4_9MICO|nr:glycosyltransferase [Microbacterium sp. ASV81]MDQ4214279.1 glycosyltransferase [Microbacterium sp. ASV81]